MATSKMPARLSKPCILIIVIASVERFAYKGVASNLVTYLTDVVKLSTAAAAKSVSTWIGVTSMLPLATAILADAYWDRYSTILASSLVYVMGLVGLTSWALVHAWLPTSSLFVPLYLISIGQGAYNPSLQAFGADQLHSEDLDYSDKEGTEGGGGEKTKFFQWWYFGICTGSLLGNSLMSYIQDNVGWGLGFAIPAIAMAFSVACFLCGTRFYVRKKLVDSDQKITDTNIFQVVKETMTKVFSARRFSLSSKEADAMELELEEKPFRDDYDDDFSENMDQNFTKPDEHPLPSVTSVILGLLPIWTMLLMFAVIFQQPATFFTKQGMAMKRNIGASFVIPPAMLQSVITISIIILMPVYDKLIVPILVVFTRDSKGITVLQRIGIGMILSVVAMVIAAMVEAKRLEIARKEVGIGLESLDMQLCVFWLLPQYILLGISDVFTVVGMQEFFYSEVPASMRTIGIGLYLSVFGFGSFLGAVLISVIEVITGAKGENCSWFSDDMREARLDKYYWFLAFFSFLSFLLFLCLCRFYRRGNASVNAGNK